MRDEGGEPDTEKVSRAACVLLTYLLLTCMYLILPVRSLSGLSAPASVLGNVTCPGQLPGQRQSVPGLRHGMDECRVTLSDCR